MVAVGSVLTAVVSAAALAALLLPRLAGPSWRQPQELVVRELRLPASGVAQLRTGPGSELVLVGPGSLTRPAGAASPLAHLAAGRLVVRAAGEDVVIDAAGRRVTVPKGHLAEVVVYLGDLLRVAAYVGDSRLRLGQRELLLHQGTAWTREGVRPLLAECQGLVAAALAGGP